LNSLEAAYGRVLGACGAVAAALVAALTGMFVLTVVLRATAGSRVTGDFELSEYAMLFITAFAVPWLLRLGRHVRLDVLLVNLTPAVAWGLELINDAVGFVVSLVMLWYGTAVLMRSWTGGTLIVKEYTIPEWWILWPLPLMFMLVAGEFVFRFRRVLGGPRRARTEGGQL
jgi:TRAP-type C4-dicarboxylate transport system permease small subunit